MELETYKTAKELIQKAGNTEYMINCLQNNTYAGIIPVAEPEPVEIEN